MHVDELDNPTAAPLHRGLNLTQAISLNVANMVGVGPFIVVGAFFSAMRGPLAILAWFVAGALVLWDGLVWSELGAALPGSGGTYHFLKEIYGPLHPKWGRLLPFLFVWQFLVSAPLETASAYIGTIDYLRYISPDLDRQLSQLGVLGGGNTLAAVMAVTITALLCRNIRVLGWLSVFLCAGTFAALLAVIISAFVHFDPNLATPSAAVFSSTGSLDFARGLGSAVTIAVYCFLGYYNICHLGDEVRDPARTIPRAVIRSIWIVGFLYVVMYVGIIGVIPWQEVIQSNHAAADLMQRLYGRWTAVGFAGLVVWTALAGAFAMTLGYSRIPFAASRKGDFFAPFAKVHPSGYPMVSLIAFGALTAICCFFSLQTVVEAAVAVRILIQFIGQIAGLHILHTRRPDIALPFRMRMYPLPSLLALCGWLFLLCTQNPPVLVVALGVTVAGIPAFFVWQCLASQRSAAI